MHQRRCRMPSPHERKQKQHLQAFRKAGVEIVCNGRKSALPGVPGYQTQMVGAAIGAAFWCESIGKVDHAEYEPDDAEQQPPRYWQSGQRLAAPAPRARER